MAEPRVRFKRDDGSSYPEWENKQFGNLFKKNNERNGDQFSSDRTISIASMTFNPNGNGADVDSLSTYKVLRVGDVAFEGHESKDYSHGRFVLNDIGDGIMSPRFSCMRPITPLNNGFWKYYIHFEAVMKDILIRATKKGTMMHELVFEDLFKQSIGVPCPEEQQKIADFLSSVDEVISTSEEEVANLETQKKVVMKKIFSQEVRFKKADGSDFPEWDETSFLSLIDEIIDFRGRTPKKLGMDWAKGKTEHLALSAINVKKGYIDFNVDPHYGDDALYEKWMTGRELRKGQVLFTTEAPMGNVAQVPDDKPYILSQRTIAFNVKQDLICEDFLAHLLLAPDTQKRLEELATGGTAKGVSQKSLSKLSVTVTTDFDEQRLIADFLSAFDEAIAAAKKELELWKELKKGLLQQMFV